jgi:hypothetical protein
MFGNSSCFWNVGYNSSRVIFRMLVMTVVFGMYARTVVFVLYVMTVAFGMYAMTVVFRMYVMTVVSGMLVMTFVFGMLVMTVVFWNVGYDCWFTVVFGKLAITALSCFWNVGYDSCSRFFDIVSLKKWNRINGIWISTKEIYN